MDKKILLLDVGNTNTKIAVADEKGIEQSYTLPTGPRSTPDSWGVKLMELCRVNNVCGENMEAFAVSSVVPSVNPLLKGAAERFFSCPALFTPGDIPLDLENRYGRPAEVGADRLVTAYAAKRLFGADKMIVIDFGTATTFDCVSGKGYLGGLICPGVISSAKALATGTAKLPHVTLEIDSDDLHIGKSTTDSLNQGLVFGFAALVEGLCERLKTTLGGDVMVIATGGMARKVDVVCSAIDEIRDDLLLEGLRLAYYERG